MKTGIPVLTLLEHFNSVPGHTDFGADILSAILAQKYTEAYRLATEIEPISALTRRLLTLATAEQQPDRIRGDVESWNVCLDVPNTFIVIVPAGYVLLPLAKLAYVQQVNGKHVTRSITPQVAQQGLEYAVTIRTQARSLLTQPLTLTLEATAPDKPTMTVSVPVSFSVPAVPLTVEVDSVTDHVVAVRVKTKLHALVRLDLHFQGGMVQSQQFPFGTADKIVTFTLTHAGTYSVVASAEYGDYTKSYQTVGGIARKLNYKFRQYPDLLFVGSQGTIEVITDTGNTLTVRLTSTFLDYEVGSATADPNGSAAIRFFPPATAFDVVEQIRLWATITSPDGTLSVKIPLPPVIVVPMNENQTAEGRLLRRTGFMGDGEHGTAFGITDGVTTMLVGEGAPDFIGHSAEAPNGHVRPQSFVIPHHLMGNPDALFDFAKLFESRTPLLALECAGIVLELNPQHEGAKAMQTRLARLIAELSTQRPSVVLLPDGVDDLSAEALLTAATSMLAVNPAEAEKIVLEALRIEPDNEEGQQLLHAIRLVISQMETVEVATVQGKIRLLTNHVTVKPQTDSEWKLAIVGGVGPYTVKKLNGHPSWATIENNELLIGAPKKKGKSRMRVSITDSRRTTVQTHIDIVVTNSIQALPAESVNGKPADTGSPLDSIIAGYALGRRVKHIHPFRIPDGSTNWQSCQLSTRPAVHIIAPKVAIAGQMFTAYIVSESKRIQLWTVAGAPLEHAGWADMDESGCCEIQFQPKEIGVFPIFVHPEGLENSPTGFVFSASVNVTVIHAGLHGFALNDAVVTQASDGFHFPVCVNPLSHGEFTVGVLLDEPVDTVHLTLDGQGVIPFWHADIPAEQGFFQYRLSVPSEEGKRITVYIAPKRDGEVLGLYSLRVPLPSPKAE